MFCIILSYTLKPFMLKALYLLLLIPVLLAVIAYFVIKKAKAAAAKRFADEDEKQAQRMKEIAEEKALDDDFGTEWHIYGTDSKQ